MWKIVNFNDPSDGDILEFFGTIMNIGGHYNRTSGTFTCPVSGFYYFSTTISAAINGEVNSRSRGNQLKFAHLINKQWPQRKKN